MTDIKMPPFKDLDRDVVLAHVALTGLLGRIPRVSSPDRKGDFGIIVRGNDSQELDRVMLCVHRNDIDGLKLLCPLFKDEMQDLFAKSDGAELQHGVLDLVTMNALYDAGVYTLRALSENVWRGVATDTRKYNFYREFDGLDAQIENVIDFESNGFDNLFDAIIAVKEELKHLAREEAVLPEWCIVTDPMIVYQMGDGIKMLADPKVSWTAEEKVLTSDVYILPLSVDEKPALFLEYADYREINAKTDENRFWTDGGLFLWTIEQQNWDFKLKAQIEAAIRLTHPQLAAKISNVSTLLLKDQS